MSFADLKAEVNDIVEDSSTTKKQTFEEKVKDEYIKETVDPAENETWVQFQQRLFKTHSQEHWSGPINFFCPYRRVNCQLYMALGSNHIQSLWLL